MRKTLFSALSIVFLARLCLAVSPENPSFENGLDGWRAYWHKVTKGDKFGIDTEIVKDGAKSFKANILTPGNRLSLSSQKHIEVTAGEAYVIRFSHFTALAKIDGGFSFRLSAYDKRNQHQGYYSHLDMSGTANLWIQNEVTFTAPPETVAIVLEFNFYGKCEVWLDTVEVRKATKEEAPDFAQVYGETPPLYEELFKAKDSDLRPKVYPYWSYYASSNYLDIANIFGVAHSNEGQIREAAEHHLASFYHFFAAKHLDLVNKHKMPVLYYPIVTALNEWDRRHAGKSVPFWGNDPEFIDTYLEVIKNHDFTEKLDMDVPQMIFLADEWLGRITKPALAAGKQIDGVPVTDIVRDKYGFGKYGMPESAEDTNPFKRIAWMRFNNDLSYKNLGLITQALREKYPRAQILGIDEWAAATPHDWGKISEHFDLVPGQALATLSGFRQFAPAYIAKFHADLTGKPVYPYLQFIKYPISVGIERLYTWCDMLFQGGASGIYVGAVEWFDRSLGHPTFSDPEKWEAMLNIIKRTQRMPALRHPERPAMALHFGSYTLMSRLRNPANGLYPVFSLLGARCRSAFKFTDDYQVERSPQVWDECAVVVITDQQYSSMAMQVAVERLLQRGGTLLVLDPLAFSHGIDGSDWSAFRRELFGVECIESEDSSAHIILPDDKKLNNPSGKIWRLTPTGQSTLHIKASFLDGAPALLEHKLKNGRVWLAAFTAANDSSVDSVPWVTQWRTWLSELGVELDAPIWRFQIPRDELSEKVWRKYACVSGNGMVYIRNFPDSSMNQPGASVSYEYKQKPTAITDDGDKLINRLKGTLLKKDRNGIFTDKGETKASNWVAKFGANECTENHIIFIFNENYPLRRGRLFFPGALPECQIEVKVADDWLSQGSIQAQDVGDDIKAAEFSLNQTTDQVRIKMARRKDNSTLTLVEADFWAEKR